MPLLPSFLKRAPKDTPDAAPAEHPAAAPKQPAAHPLDALTGGAFTAATSGERAQRVREWLATNPSAEDMQQVYKELSGKDKGAAKALREKLDELRRASRQQAIAAEWQEKAQALLAAQKLNIADAMAWQRDAAKAGAPLSQEPLAGLRTQLAQRIKAIEDLQQHCMVQREAALLLAQRIEMLSARPWRDAQAQQDALQKDVDDWHAALPALTGHEHYDSVDLRHIAQLDDAKAKLAAVWEAFSAALAQAIAAAEDAAAPLPSVPVWADELRAARQPQTDATDATATAVDPEQAAAAAKAIKAGAMLLEKATAEGNSKNIHSATQSLRHLLKEHDALLDKALKARAHHALAAAGELSGWQHWSAGKVREQLIARAEGLLRRQKKKGAAAAHMPESSEEAPAAEAASQAENAPAAAAAPETAPAAPSAEAAPAAPETSAAPTAAAETTTETPVAEAAAPAEAALAAPETAPAAPSAEAAPASPDAAPAAPETTAEPTAAAETTAEAPAAEAAAPAAETTAEAAAPAAEQAAPAAAVAKPSRRTAIDLPPLPDDEEWVPTLPPHKLQEALRQLREEWKAADQGGASSQAMWQRFDRACNAARVFVDRWIQHARAETAAHKAQRLALIAELKAWAATQPAEGANWKTAGQQLAAFRRRWFDKSHTGRLPAKLYAQLQEDWKAAFEAASAPLHDAQKQSIARRRALIAEAGELAAAPLRIDAIQTLQQTWQAEAQAVPLLDRRLEQKLWNAFRKPIDEAFQRRSQERQRQRAALTAHDQAVMNAAKALEEAAASGDATRIRAAMQALQAAQAAAPDDAPAPAAPVVPDAPETPAAEGESASESEPAAPAAEAKPARRPVVAMRGDDRPGMRRGTSMQRDERRGGGNQRDGRRSGGAAGGRGERGSRDTRDGREGGRGRQPRAPRLGNAAFHAQREALDLAQSQLKKLAAQAHGEAIAAVLDAWQTRDAAKLPSAQQLGAPITGAARNAWVTALQGEAKGDAAAALLRLEIAAEAPTPAAHLDARRALQLQLLTQKGSAMPADTWPQDTATILAAPASDEATQRLQTALKALLRAR